MSGFLVKYDKYLFKGNYSGGAPILGNPPLCNCSTVLQIRSFGTSKHTSAIREGQNGRSWSAAEQLHLKFHFLEVSHV